MCNKHRNIGMILFGFLFGVLGAYCDTYIVEGLSPKSFTAFFWMAISNVINFVAIGCIVTGVLLSSVGEIVEEPEKKG